MFLRKLILLTAVFAAILVVPAFAENAAQYRKSCAEKTTRKKYTPRKVFARLFETLTTRPGVTEPYIIEALHSAALGAGKDMMAELQQYTTSENLRIFACTLLADLEKFVQDYAEAEPGEAGQVARVQLTCELFQGLLATADNAKIPLGQFEMAILRGCERFEKGLERPSVEDVLSAADRELIDLLLLEALHQFSARIYVQEFSDALQVINPLPVPNWPERWQQLKGVLENTLEMMVTDLEADVLGEPAVLADANKLLLYQLNELAKSDLLGYRIGMEVYFAAIDEDDLQNLADRMDTVGGVMAGMTVETLLQSGLFGTFEDPYGGGPIIHLDEIVVFDWVKPDMLLSYRPVENLQIQLALLGSEIPASPAFSLFDVPYLPIFQLEYDLDLCDEILKAEKRGFDDQLAEEFRPMSMQERYTLKREDVRRRDKIFKRLRGVSESEKGAVRVILTPIVSSAFMIH